MTRSLLALALLPGCFLIKKDESARCRHDRPFEIGLQDDVVALAGCKRVFALTIRTGATIDLAPLRELEEVTGDISIGPTVGLDEASFIGVVRVGGTIRVANNGSLRGLFLPRLVQAGRIEVDNNAVLSTISMPRLATVQGSIVITDNTNLELLSASLLATIGKELVISGHPKLSLVQMTRVASMEAIRVEVNPKLPPDVLDHLVSKSATPPPNPARSGKAAEAAKPGDKPAAKPTPRPVRSTDKGPKPKGVPVDKTGPKPTVDLTGPTPTGVPVEKPGTPVPVDKSGPTPVPVDKSGPKPTPVPVEKSGSDKTGPQPTPVPVEKSGSGSAAPK